jgi:hypothetical protein
MPKRTDISKILILGSGPIVIGRSAANVLKGRAFKARRKESTEEPALAAEVER